jgi:uncharacterized protein (TIGR03083 family)
MTPMDRSHYLAALRRDADTFAVTLASASLDAPVPSCPEWTAADLVYHLGEVHSFWNAIVAGRLTAPDVAEPPRPPDSELLGWYAVGTETLIDTLTAADDATPVWTWSDEPADHTAGFVLRRMALETAVHCWDAAASAGASFEMEPELASDGVDEFLHKFLNTRAIKGEPIGGSVHLHCTDVAGEWLVVQGEDGSLTVTREHAKGTAALRGTGHNLLLAVWRRIGIDEIDVVGDAAVAGRFVAASNLE